MKSTIFSLTHTFSFLVGDLVCGLVLLLVLICSCFVLFPSLFLVIPSLSPPPPTKLIQKRQSTAHINRNSQDSKILQTHSLHTCFYTWQMCFFGEKHQCTVSSTVTAIQSLLYTQRSCTQLALINYCISKYLTSGYICLNCRESLLVL